MGLCGEEPYPYIDRSQPKGEDGVRRAFVSSVFGETKALIVNGVCN